MASQYMDQQKDFLNQTVKLNDFQSIRRNESDQHLLKDQPSIYNFRKEKLKMKKRQSLLIETQHSNPGTPSAADLFTFKGSKQMKFMPIMETVLEQHTQKLYNGNNQAYNSNSTNNQSSIREE